MAMKRHPLPAHPQRLAGEPEPAAGGGHAQAEVYGAEAASLWWMCWRIFFMAGAELFGCRRGQEWWVAHYLFERRDHA